MNCRSRASRLESITALKTKHNYLDSGVNRLCSDGKMIPVQIQKQTDPNSKHEKYPAIKCPLCRKFLYAVPNKNTRDLMLVYNLKDKRYSSFSPDYVLRCPRCHVTLGIFYRLSDRKIWAADSGWKARIISIEYGGNRQKLKKRHRRRSSTPSFFWLSEPKMHSEEYRICGQPGSKEWIGTYPAGIRFWKHARGFRGCLSEVQAQIYFVQAQKIPDHSAK